MFKAWHIVGFGAGVMGGKSRLLQGITGIIGEQLSSVEFVQDYVQLHFDGPILTAFVWPVVRIPGALIRVKDPGYKDALCARIGRNVRKVNFLEAVELLVEFEDDSIISVSLRLEDSVGPEAGHFSTGGATPMLEF